MKMTLNEACAFWGLKQSEVNFITSDFEKKQWWENNRTLERVEVADKPGTDNGIKTRFGHVLKPTELKAYRTLKRMLEKEESYSNSHGMADAFRSYFKEV